MKRPILFAAILMASCPSVQVRQAKPPIPPPTQKRQPTACETAMGKRHLVEKVLGKWHEKGLSGIRSIYFLEQSVGGEGATFDPDTKDIAISAIPLHSISGNIDAVDHEVGHSIYEQIKRMKGLVSVPFLDHYVKLRKKYKKDAALKKSDEFRQHYREFGRASISGSLTIDEWDEFLAYLKDYTEAKCVRSYIQAFYIDKADMMSKKKNTTEIVLIAKIMNLKAAQLSEEDAQNLHLFLEEYRKVVSEFKRESDAIRPFLIKAMNPTDEPCVSKVNERYSEMLAKASIGMARLLRSRKMILEMQKRNAELVDKDGLGSTVTNESLVSGIISGFSQSLPPDLLENELFARAVDSLMDLYYGPAQNNRFRLDERILATFEKIAIEDVPIFAEAVSRYRKGLEMLKQGVSLYEIQKTILLPIPSRPYPGLFCKSKTTDQ